MLTMQMSSCMAQPLSSPSRCPPLYFTAPCTRWVQAKPVRETSTATCAPALFAGWAIQGHLQPSLQKEAAVLVRPVGGNLPPVRASRRRHLFCRNGVWSAAHTYWPVLEGKEALGLGFAEQDKRDSYSQYTNQASSPSRLPETFLSKGIIAAA